jgi:hypothetical protein
VKRECKIDGKGFKKLKNTQYILASFALILCIVLPILLSLVSTEITSKWITDLLMMVGVLTAFSSAVIASYIRYKKGVSYATGALVAFVMFSFVYQVVPHPVTFALTLAVLCATVFVLTFGAYNARGEKGAMVTYICTALICGIWFLASCV